MLLEVVLYIFGDGGDGVGVGEDEYLDQIRVKNWQLFPNQNICCGYPMYHLKTYVLPFVYLWILPSGLIQ